MRPAETVGGDYYDLFEADNKVWVLVGDVSGHGVGAGLVMMMVQTAVRALVCSLTHAGHALSPARLLALVNEALQVNLHLLGRGQYMTINALCLDGANIRYAGLHQARVPVKIGGARSADAILLELVVQRSQPDSKLLGRLLAMSTAALQRFGDGLLLKIFERGRSCGRSDGDSRCLSS